MSSATPLPQTRALKQAAVQRQKKPRCNGATNSTKQRPVADMGMFFLKRNNIKATDVFPKDIPTKICANFTCKGRECTRDSPAHAATLGMLANYPQTLAAITRHFSTKKIGWLNECHFMKLAHPPPNVKALVGGKDGPSSSKRA
jgi:hypothetical protein